MPHPRLSKEENARSLLLPRVFALQRGETRIAVGMGAAASRTRPSVVGNGAGKRPARIADEAAQRLSLDRSRTQEDSREAAHAGLAVSLSGVVRFPGRLLRDPASCMVARPSQSSAQCRRICQMTTCPHTKIPLL